MKALIIGGGGFVGRYLAEHLVQDCGWETFLTKLPKENVEVEGCEAYYLDILDKDAVEALLVRLKPDAILHLAAQSSVAYSWKNPQLTADINIHGCLNVLDAVRSVPGYAPKILLIGSGEEYGVLPENTSLVSETTPVHPANPYAITKLAQNLFGELYAKAYDMHIMMVRAFNHIGPGQLPQFVVSDFCKQVAEISAGVREPVMRVGNLTAARDFTDVRDVVRAYSLLIEHGRSGEVYNVGSGRAHFHPGDSGPHHCTQRHKHHRGSRPGEAASGRSAGDPGGYLQAPGGHRLAAGDPAGTDHCRDTGRLEKQAEIRLEEAQAYGTIGRTAGKETGCCV